MSNKSANKLFPLIQSIILLVLIAAIVVLSFGTIFTVEVDISPAMKSELQSAIREITGTNTKIPSEIKVNIFTYFKSFAAISSLIEALDGSSGSVSKKISAEDAKVLAESATFAYILVARIITAVDESGSDYAIVSAIGEALIALFCMIFLFIIAIICLISALIATIKGIIGICRRNKDFNKLINSLNNSLMRIVKRFPSLLIVLVLSSELSLGKGFKGIIIAGIAAIILGVVASRLKKYGAAEYKFLNSAQLVSAGAIVGLVLFVIGIVKTKLFGNCIHMLLIALIAGDSDILPTFIFLPLIIVALCFAVKSIIRILPRVGCMSITKNYNNIPHASIALSTIVLTLLFNALSDVLDTSKIVFSDEAEKGFILAAIGLVIILATEILLSVLTKKLCANCPEKTRKEIMNGTYLLNKTTAPAAPAAEDAESDAPAEAEATAAPKE